MRKRWLLLPAAALIAMSAALVNASVSGAGSADVPTTTNVKVWVGLKNSDDVGTRFDLKADVTNNSGTVSGVLPNFSGGSSGFNNAHLATIPVVTTGQVSSVKIWARVSCQSGHTSGTARLWWNDTAANSRVEPDGSGVRYLTGTNTLSPSVGPSPKMTSDVLVKKTGCPAEQPVGNWKLFGTWTEPETNPTVSASVTGGTMSSIVLFDTTNQVFLKSCANVSTTCSALGAEGLGVSVLLRSGSVLSGGGTPFTFTCNGGSSQSAHDHVPLNNPSGTFYQGECLGTMSGDYTVTATFS
jgi:hypothetical protein